MDALGDSFGYGALVVNPGFSNSAPASNGFEGLYSELIAPAPVNTPTSQLSVDAYIGAISNGGPTNAATRPGDYVPSTTIDLPAYPGASNYGEVANGTAILNPPAAAPANGGPAATKPATTKPAATKPATTKPAATKPATAKPEAPKRTAAEQAFIDKVAKMTPAEKKQTEIFLALAVQNEEKARVDKALPRVTVQAGDGWIRITDRYNKANNANIDWHAVEAANKDVGTTRNGVQTIHPGNVIKIPDMSKVPPKPKAPAPKPEAPAAPKPDAPKPDASKQAKITEIKKTDNVIKELVQNTNEWKKQLQDPTVSTADKFRLQQSISDNIAYIHELLKSRETKAKELGASAPKDPNKAAYTALGVKI